MGISDRGGIESPLRGILSVLMVSILMEGVMASLAVKETKVEPFSLLLNQQRQILGEMDVIARAVVLLESRLKSIEYEVISTRSKVEEAYRDLGALKDGGLLEGCISQGQPQYPLAGSARNPCRDLEALFKDGSRDIAKCNLLLGVRVRGLVRPHEEDNVGAEIPVEVSEQASTSALKAALDMQENLLLEIGRLISAEANHTQAALLDLMSLTHTIEYRQHTSALAHDTRLATLLQKMGVHQRVLEERLTAILRNELGIIKDRIDTKLSAIENRTLMDEQILNSSVPIATNLTFTWRAMTSRALNESVFCNDASNCSHLEEDEITHQDVPQAHTNTNKTLTFPTAPILRSSEETLQGDSPIDENNVVNLSSSPNLPSTVERLFINTRHNNDGAQIKQPEQSLNEVNQAFDYFVEENQKSKSRKGQSLATQDITRISSLMNERVENMENFISKRLLETEERLTGLRIHQTSSLYSHTKEMRHEMEKLERRLWDAIQSGGAKSAKQLDAVRKSLFTFIDAAVTSISSAAVTSSQSTRLLVARDLRESFEELRRFIREENPGTQRESGGPSCPEIYQEVAGKCLLALTHVGVTWGEGCRLCRSLGGYLARPLVLDALRNLNLARDVWVWDNQFPAQGSECNLDTRKERSEELTNSLVELPPHKGGSESPDDSTDPQCRFITPRGLRFETTECTQDLGVLCQYEHHPRVP